MKLKLDFGLDNIRGYAVHILVFLILFVLILKVLFPQLENVAVGRDLLVESNSKLESLNTKVKFLESLDKTANRQKLQRLNLALPVEKDVGLMLDALIEVVARSNVRLGNLTLSAAPLNSKIGLPILTVTLNLKGEISDIGEFITGLGKILPVMQATNVSLKGTSSTVTLSFYFKPVKTEEVTKQISQEVPKISKNQEEIFQRILEREAPSTIFLESESQPTVGRADPFY